MSSAPSLGLDHLAYSCGSEIAFPLAALSQPLGAENANNPAAAALRAHLANSPFAGLTGWQLVALSGGRALFLRPPATTDPGTPEYLNAQFEVVDNEWRYVRSGACQVQPVIRGLGLGTWELASNGEISVDTTSFDVLVTEQNCASGATPDGRIELADTIYGNDAIVIILGVRPLPGAQTCPGNPPGLFTVHLDEAVGGRSLLDGSVFPPERRGD
ncbi:MAG: hypothetical protein M3295_02745 [Chloroflexota bacterium]|nr:hypothetical protein [Chloroflexota bacterium]